MHLSDVHRQSLRHLNGYRQNYHRRNDRHQSCHHQKNGYHRNYLKNSQSL